MLPRSLMIFSLRTATSHHFWLHTASRILVFLDWKRKAQSCLEAWGCNALGLVDGKEHRVVSEQRLPWCKGSRMYDHRVASMDGLVSPDTLDKFARLFEISHLCRDKCTTYSLSFYTEPIPYCIIVITLPKYSISDMNITTLQQTQRKQVIHLYLDWTLFYTFLLVLHCSTLGLTVANTCASV